MTWEAVSAVAAILGLLLLISQRIGALTRAHVTRAEEATREKEQMKGRINTVERELKGMGDRLSTHIEHTGTAIDALRNELPGAIGAALSKALHENALTQDGSAPTPKPRTKRASAKQ